MEVEVLQNSTKLRVMQQIDINCDMGEGLGNEAELMPFISSCNIACAAHAGSVSIIDNTIALAKLHEVKVGAHPAYPDKVNFGRKILDMPLKELQESIESQIQLVKDRAILQGVSLNHVKMHGALYNLSAVDKAVATIVVRALKNTFKGVLYVPYNSEIERVAKSEDVSIAYEVFIDRNYNDDLTLLSRTQKNALITDSEIALSHVLEIVKNQNIKTISGVFVPVKADTFCIHGDNASAVDILKFLSEKLKASHIEIA